MSVVIPREDNTVKVGVVWGGAIIASDLQCVKSEGGKPPSFLLAII